MAIYHLSAQIIKRSTGRSVTAAAAYRAHERIEDERTGLTHDFTRRRGEVEAFILAPDQAPDWAHDRSALWNEVEKIEKRKDAQLARELNVALPVELTPDQQKDLLKEFIDENMVSRGMIADVAIHRDHPENPHAHVMLTMRDISADGFGKKNREWNPDFSFGQVKNAEKYVDWREAWANLTNEHLSFYRHEARIDHRTLEAQGIDRLPTIHEGPAVHQMEWRGIQTERGDHNRMVQEHAQIVAEQKQNVVDFEEFRWKKEQERELLQKELAKPERKPLKDWTREELADYKAKAITVRNRTVRDQQAHGKYQDIQRRIDLYREYKREGQERIQQIDGRNWFAKLRDPMKEERANAEKAVKSGDVEIQRLEKELPPPHEMKRLEEAAPKFNESINALNGVINSIDRELNKRDEPEQQQITKKKQRRDQEQTRHGRGMGR